MSVDGGREIDEILDEGRCGLVYFEHYLPILRRTDPSSTWTYPDLCARYDEQRGLTLALLAGDAVELDRCVTEAREQLTVQQRSVDVLAGAWFGSAAQFAVEDLRSDTNRGRLRTDEANELCQAMAGAVGGIRGAVEDKATAIGRFGFGSSGTPERSSVAGMSFDHVRAIDFLAGIDPTESMTVALGLSDIRALTNVLPSVVAPAANSSALPNFERGGSVEGSPEAELHHARAVCEKWLRETFAPVVAAACEHVVDVCAATDTAVRGCLSTIVAVAEGMNGVFAAAGTGGETASAVGTRPTASTDAEAPSSSGAGRVVDAGVGLQAASQSSAAHPLTSAPAASKDSVQSALGLIPDCEQIVRAFERAGHELTERMKSVLDDALSALSAEDVHDGDTPGQSERAHSLPPQPSIPPAPPIPTEAGRDSAGVTLPSSDSKLDPAPQLPSLPLPSLPPSAPPFPPDASAPTHFVERGHLEAALDGHSARIAVAHNGAVAVEFATPTGSSRFELRPGPFGLPVVVRTDEAADTPQIPPAPPPAEPAPPPAEPVGAVSPTSETPPAPAPPPDPAPAPPPDPAPAPPPDPAPAPPADPAPAPAPDIAGDVRRSGARLMEAGPL